ncbi:deoxyribonuclease [Echinococcus multilocularis]|uniref:Deoxyribonuclease n=1 Tax=Echinococcus multilocularis TaxID=6211 RepID=A0A068Y3T9_ECHMU|nr:deoxyribonuclease [Echinococcus multilocularis]CUT98673.1 deoxyribonuclease [Echinococcus multilocularis]
MILLSLLLVVCLLGLPAPSEQKIKSAAFNVQVFGKSKSTKADVMKLLVDIFLRYHGAVIEEIRDNTDEAIQRLLTAINAASPPDNITVVGLASMRTRMAEFERPPDCFSLIIKESGLRVALLAIHVSPKYVVKELDALYDVTNECERFAGTTNLVLLGDMNADCTYLSKQARDKLRLRTDRQYAWRITDDMDTTVSDTKCAYDRVITKGPQMARRIPAANPFNFRMAYRLDLQKVGCQVVLWLNA